MVYLSPIGLSAAATPNSLSFLAVYKERLCREVCTTATNIPFATIAYRYETPTLNGTTLFVPIVATITIGLPNRSCGSVQTITERFDVAFQGITALPTAITITDGGNTQRFSEVCCGESRSMMINSSVVVAITAG